MDLPLPIADSGKTVSDVDRPALIVNVLAGGRIMISGRTVAKESLGERLQEAVADKGAKLEVKIRAHRDVPYRFLEPIMLACNRAGVHDITYSVFRSKDVH